MAKVFTEQVKKAQALVAGLKAHSVQVESRCGIAMEQVQDLEAVVDEAARLNSEVEALREEVSLKVAVANEKLEEMKQSMMNLKRQIKHSFAPSKWVDLGIPDKR